MHILIYQPNKFTHHLGKTSEWPMLTGLSSEIFNLKTLLEDKTHHEWLALMQKGNHILYFLGILSNALNRK